jgi:hypothetical protein
VIYTAENMIHTKFSDFHVYIFWGWEWEWEWVGSRMGK